MRIAPGAPTSAIATPPNPHMPSDSGGLPRRHARMKVQLSGGTPARATGFPITQRLTLSDTTKKLTVCGNDRMR